MILLEYFKKELIDNFYKKDPIKAIAKSVTKIEGSAFKDCAGLQSIYVGSNNKNYLSKNGVLFDKSITKLICYPEGKPSYSYTIPNSSRRLTALPRAARSMS